MRPEGAAGVPPEQLCYPGKSIELRVDGGMVRTTVTGVSANRIAIADSVPSGEVEVMVVFFLERYRAHGVAGSRLGEGSSTNVVVVDGGFSLVNERSSPRVPVTLVGTYYLRPPHLGVPCELVDLSVSGVALNPITGVSASPTDRRMVAFDLVGRQIKAVIEIVTVEPLLWRARFVKLGVSDEQAIAAYLLSHQLAGRRGLSQVEIGTPSSLDVATRLEYPLLEALVLEGASMRLATGEMSVSVPVPATLEFAHSDVAGLVGSLRFADLGDILHYLRRCSLDADVSELVAVACVAMSTLVSGQSVHTLIQALIGGPSPTRRRTVVLPGGYVAGATHFRDGAARTWRLVARSLGCALYRVDEGSARPMEKWSDPRSFASLMASSDGEVVVASWWSELAELSWMQQILDSFIAS